MRLNKQFENCLTLLSFKTDNSFQRKQTLYKVGACGQFNSRNFLFDHLQEKSALKEVTAYAILKAKMIFASIKMLFQLNFTPNDYDSTQKPQKRALY